MSHTNMSSTPGQPWIRMLRNAMILAGSLIRPAASGSTFASWPSVSPMFAN